MNEIDKWCAEQCGLEPYEHLLYVANDGERHYKTQVIIDEYPASCSLNDANFREIVRERFKIATFPIVTLTEIVFWYSRDINGNYNTEHLPDIERAEIACITAIYEQENTNE